MAKAVRRSLSMHNAADTFHNIKGRWSRNTRMETEGSSSAHHRTSDRLERLGNSSDGSAKHSQCNLQKTHALVFCSGTDDSWSNSISSSLRNFSSQNLKCRNRKKGRKIQQVSSKRERHCVCAPIWAPKPEGLRLIQLQQRAASALVEQLLKGEPQLCLISKASTGDTIKHNKQAAPLCSVRKTGRKEQNARI